VPKEKPRTGMFIRENIIKVFAKSNSMLYYRSDSSH
jgi:hypothetical protein